ncbi:hypothetical protein CWM66_08485 [Kosakonia sp. H7A]|uniref:hypothetical protein n=1 Tax=Kosakonia sp. H7A TaxID=2054598 RepID=UPI000D177220|nr:hypothetical protein [Kosakonia sp. H7A]PTA91273.1 hypothetical protein CWM66_08485 [Kosakonia sp. H7A]
MTNNDDLALKEKQLAYLKQLSEFMTERFSMNPVSCKIINEDWKKRFPDEVAIADTLISLLAERTADKAENASLRQRVAELLSENGTLKNSVENAAGCINAAYAEGLLDVLSESNDERLTDLVKRRLLFAYLPVETPATNEELIAMGDWVLRDQLDDGTRAIKLLNQRVADLEAYIDTTADFETYVTTSLILSGHLEPDVTFTQEALLELLRSVLVSKRTVSVKLPKTMYTEFDNDDYCREVAVLDKQQVIDALAAAGIKLEVGE